MRCKLNNTVSAINRVYTYSYKLYCYIMTSGKKGNLNHDLEGIKIIDLEAVIAGINDCPNCRI